MKGKRDQILRASLELFLEKGMKGMKVSAIAAQADIGKGTVYEYFTSKEELFLGTVEYGIGLLADMLNEKLEGTESYREGLDNLVDCMADIAAKGPFMTFMTDTSNMPFSMETIAKLKLIMQDALKSFMSMAASIVSKGVLEGLIKQPASPEYIRALMVIVGNMTMQAVHNGETDLGKLKEFYYDASLKLLS